MSIAITAENTLAYLILICQIAQAASKWTESVKYGYRLSTGLKCEVMVILKQGNALIYFFFFK